MCLHFCSRGRSLQQFWKKQTICLDYPGFSSGIEVRLVSVAADSILGWMWVAADSILRLTRVPAAGYELRLSRAPVAGCKLRLRRVLAAGYNLRLTRVPAARYELQLILSCGYLEFRRLDTSYSWLHPTTDSSSGTWIRFKADFILRLTMSCDWLELRRLYMT